MNRFHKDKGQMIQDMELNYKWRFVYGIKNSLFSHIIFDTGLFVAMLDEEAQEDLRANKNLGVYKGALYENIVSEALVKSGYGLYYYKKEDST